MKEVKGLLAPTMCPYMGVPRYKTKVPRIYTRTTLSFIDQEGGIFHLIRDVIC